MKSLIGIGSILLLLGAITGACNDDLNVGDDQDGGAKGDGGSTSAACTSSVECSSGDVCAFAEADTCSAKGECVTPPSGATCGAISYACACDGSEVEIGCNGLPDGYVSKPFAHDGACAAEAGADSGTCVDINPASYSASCTSSSDCETIRTGEVCSGECNCGDVPTNSAGFAKYQAATNGLSFEGCPCAFPGTVECVANQCTLCTGAPGQPAGCSAGTDGGGLDAGSADGGTCVDINPASYSTSCSTDDDCGTIRTGEVCSGECNCGDVPTNSAGLAQYQTATSGLSFDQCPCAFPGTIHCIASQCAVCTGLPGQPAGCPGGADGGS